MKKVLLGLFLFGCTSVVFSKSSISSDIQMKIIKEQTYALNKCSSLALIDSDVLLSSESNQINCTVPYIVFSESQVFDDAVIDKEEQLILKAASAVAYGIIIRNKSDRGIPIKDEDREKFYSHPYDDVTTKQMPKAVCAYLLALYDNKPQYFNASPSCKKMIEFNKQ